MLGETDIGEAGGRVAEEEEEEEEFEVFWFILRDAYALAAERRATVVLDEKTMKR